MAKLANFNHNGDREMGFGSLDGGEHDQYSGVGIVIISCIFAMQDAY